MDPVRIRPAEPPDAPLLWELLTYAASMPDPGPGEVRAAMADPYLREWVAGWGRAGDFGVVADREDGRCYGAAWARVMCTETPGVDPVAPPGVPELAIAVRPGLRRLGIGTRLLEALIGVATGRAPALALSVRELNPAAHLYLRCGFAVERIVTNRVGTRSQVMLRAL